MSIEGIEGCSSERGETMELEKKMLSIRNSVGLRCRQI